MKHLGPVFFLHWNEKRSSKSKVERYTLAVGKIALYDFNDSVVAKRWRRRIE
jgi:hypothetical protein